MSGWRLPATLAAAGWVGVALGGGPAAAPKADRGKGTIEVPVKSVLAGVKVDVGKSVVERPLKGVILVNTAVPAAGQAAAPAAAPAFTNPKVEPGKVRWHESFAAACAAARKSGKPVLLFQMMGRLDQRFC